MLLALDEAKEVRLVATEIGVNEVPVLFVIVALEDTLLKVRDFVKAVHVQLAHEGAEVAMFEPPTQNFMGETFVVQN